MKIAEIERYRVSVPLRETFWPTWIPRFPQTINRFTLVKLTTDDGIDGYSVGTTLAIKKHNEARSLRTEGKRVTHSIPFQQYRSCRPSASFLHRSYTRIPAGVDTLFM